VTLIKERYELLETLGVGGEGHVVKALDRHHGRFVALKIRSVRDGQAREELLNEARVLLAVPPHPALPMVREDFFDGDAYLVAMGPRRVLPHEDERDRPPDEAVVPELIRRRRRGRASKASEYGFR
jgi:hypothetical protein